MSATDPNSGRASMQIIVPESADQGPMSLELIYQFPLLDTSRDSRTTEHDPIGEERVIQHLGTNPLSLTFRGSCYRDEAAAIRQLPDVGVVEIISDDWAGDAIVKNISTGATGSGGGERAGVGNRVQDYTLQVTAIDGQEPGQG